MGTLHIKITRAKKELLVFSLASVAVALIYYGPFLNNFFILDDYKYIENIFRGPLDVILGYNSIRVISNSIWWPLYSIFGFDPFIFNLFSIVLYSANAVLLYLLLSTLLKDRGYALLGGAFFLLNAVGCDAVFWKAASGGLLSLFFCLLTLYNYVTYRQKGAGFHGVLAVLFFIFAMFSKEDAASLPFIIILIELLYFDGLKDKKAVLTRAAPYIAVVMFYMVTAYLLRSHIDNAKFFKPRPLYALFGGWTVFFLNPRGFLTMSDPRIYLTGAGIVLSFFWVKDKKVLFLGYGWILLSFLPQSLTSLGEFQPRYIITSISRYLYIPSVGSSLIFAAVLLRLREMLSARAFVIAAAVSLALFAGINNGEVEERGAQWRKLSEPAKPFLAALKQEMPDFPPDSHVYVINGPIPRSYMQQALRGFYKRTDISWIFNPEKYTTMPGESAFVIMCDWKKNDGGVGVDVLQVSNVPKEAINYEMQLNMAKVGETAEKF
ncbi:MAG: hypothetical protein WA666_04835 [Nitrospirota bacterium]